MRNVVVVGLGRSGIECVKLLAAQGETVFITELRDEGSIGSSVESLVKEGVVKEQNLEIGSHTERFIKQADLMVVSPGVRGDAFPIRLAEERNIPIIGELELAYSLCPAPIIAITGTSGKTTVTTLVGRMLAESGRDTVVCGNIGNPLSSEIKRIKNNSIVVLEVSSFQLERIKAFKPKVSVILNISENHLDRHRDMSEYIAFKSRIFSNQDEKDIVFLNGRDELVRKIYKTIKRPRVEFYDEYRDFRRRYNIENENFLAAMSIAFYEGVDEDTMLRVLSGFKGIEHRLEYVAKIKGVDFINDSKATTISSVVWALKSLDNSRIILIMGGRYKGGDFGRLKDLIEEKVDCVITIGEAKEQIKMALAEFKDVISAEGLETAVKTAFEMAKERGKILLSPGCSSFDMFKDYEERGRVFKEIVRRLVG